MAIYHLHCDIIGRGGGRSAVAAAAYRSSEKLYSEVTDESFDYRKKTKPLCKLMLVPNNAPEFARNRKTFWNEVELKENRCNSQFCRSFDIALPKELSLNDNMEILKKWAGINYVSRGLVADICIHPEHKNKKTGKGNDNIHAHILVSVRGVNSNGWEKKKDRESNDRNFLKEVRKSWADICNKKFEELGIDERIDHRTLEEQGIDREPQQHMGVVATAMQRKGKQTRRKKYKSEQEEEIIIPEPTEEEIENALNSDYDFVSLNAQKQALEIQKKLDERQKKEEEDLKRKCLNAQKIISESENPEETKKGIIDVYKTEICFHYLKQNTKEELQYWREQKNKNKFEEVKKIANYPKFDSIIYPDVNKYLHEIKLPDYDEITGRVNKQTHLKRFVNWVKTTDFPPVKICRQVIGFISGLGGRGDRSDDRADGKKKEKKIKTR